MDNLIATLVFPGEPISPVNQYKARAVKMGHKWTAMMYMDSKFNKHKDNFIEYVKKYKAEHDLQTYAGPVKVVAEFYFGTKRRKDLPNAGKLEWDALNELIWEDDSQILKLETEKRYDKENPRVEIKIYQFTSEHWPVPDRDVE